MIGAFQAGIFGVYGGAPFTDPRVGKTNLITGAATSASITFGAAITGPDGTASGVRATSTGTNGRIAIPAFGLAGSTLYTVGAYFRTPSDQSIRQYLGLSTGEIATGATAVNIGNIPNWTLVEVSMTTVQGAGNWYLWLGANNQWTTGEWLEYALPMVYLGNKVT